MSPDGLYFSTYAEYDSIKNANLSATAAIVRYFSDRPGVAYQGTYYPDPYDIPPVVAGYALDQAYDVKARESYGKYASFATDLQSRFSEPGGTASFGNPPPPGAGSYQSCAGYVWSEYTQPPGGCITSNGDLLATLFDATKYEGPVSGLGYQQDDLGYVFPVTAAKNLPFGQGYMQSSDPQNSFVAADGSKMPAPPFSLTSTGTPGSGSASSLSDISGGFASTSIVAAVLAIAVLLAALYVALKGARLVLKRIRAA